MNRPIRRVATVVVVLFLALVGQLTYLQLIDAKRLEEDPRNVRNALRDFSRPRGDIVTADGQIVARSVKVDDEFKYQRQYLAGNPAGTLLAAVTGFFSVLYGNTGVEKSYNDELVGRDLGLNLANFREFFTKSPTGTLVLNLDTRAQQAARDALAQAVEPGKGGSVVVVEARSGQVVALWSEPSYDPNVLAGHDVEATRQAFDFLTAIPANPMLTRAFQERFPPGSTFKIVTTAVALDAGIATPETAFPSVREIDLPQTEATIRNFGGRTCGGTLEESFVQSCNTTFARLGLELGEQLAEGLAGFGIGQFADPPPFDVPGAASSTGPPAGSFKENQPLFAQAGIGQGEVAVTPLEMALVAASVANAGVLPKPHAAREVRGPDDSVVKEIEAEDWLTGMTPQTAATLTQFMIEVVERGTGTAAQIPGVQVAGKTGTAQTGVGDPHAWFVGFAPADAGPDEPVYAFAVLVENGGSFGSEATGGQVAAPIAKSVLEALLAQR